MYKYEIGDVVLCKNRNPVGKDKPFVVEITQRWSLGSVEPYVRYEIRPILSKYLFIVDEEELLPKSDLVEELYEY